MNKIKLFLSAVLLLTVPTIGEGAKLGIPTGLMCELLGQPELTVITDDRPEFGWVVNDSRRDALQLAYHIIVSSTRDRAEKEVGDIWDSQEVRSTQSINVEYAGKPLTANSMYYWRVRTLDGAGKRSPFSTVQQFRTGKLLNEKDRGLLPTADFSNRYPLEKTKVSPLRIHKKAEGHYFIDFGRAAFGTIQFTVEANASKRDIEVHLGEVLAGAETIERNPGGSRRYRKMVVALQPGTNTVAITPDKRNSSGAAVLMPRDVGEVMPFRYCELVNFPGELRASQIQQIVVHYRFNEGASFFRSTNKVLNDVWDLCKYSIKATSFAGVYVDGDRERIPYEGDAYINQLCHYGADREYTLARYSTEYLLAHPTWPAEWQMHMPMMAWMDYLWTGNADLLARSYDQLAAKTLIGLAREDGLIVEDKTKMTPEFKKSLGLNAEVRVLVDWPPANFTKGNKYGERDGYDMRPVNTVANAFHFHTLVLMERIAIALGKTTEAERWRTNADRVKQSFNKVFFDAKNGRYIDGEGSEHSALHANMLALAFGLVPEGRTDGVVDFIKTRGMACSVYGAQHLMDGLYSAGAADYAFSLLTATNDRSWAHMIYTVGSTISLEAWDNKYKENQDWNHAWGAAPANIIPRLLMGIEPLEPGFSRVRIRPQTASLTDAEIVTPTIRGPFKLKIQQPTGKPWRAEVTIPANTVAEFHLPTSDASVARESGRPLSKARGVKILRTENNRLVVEFGGGVYKFEVKDLKNLFKR